MTPIQQAIAHARTQHDTYLNGYKQLLRIPSISTDPDHEPDVQRAAQWVANEMTRIGLHNCRPIQGDGHPVVYGEWLQAGDDKPTILIYAHYDVQPVDPLELWESPPFEPTIRDGKLFCRGVIDDKIGVYTNLKAFESMFATQGKLPVNIKCFFEGEEESGSPSMLPFIQQHKELLKADLLLICDGGSPKEQPMIYTGLRGILPAHVTVTCPIRDLHSGSYGGVVRNPIHVVADIISSFHDDEGRLGIAGIYDNLTPLSPKERDQMVEAFDMALPKMKAETGVKAFWGDAVAPVLERATVLPTLDVNGVWGGYQGPGIKTIIPSQAGFKATMRLVPNQDPARIAQLFAEHVQAFADNTATIEVNFEPGMRGVNMLHDGPVIDAIQNAYEATWGKKALFYRAGGSVPVTSIFQDELDLPVSILGFGVGEGGHSPNEFLWLEHFQMGIESAIHFYERMGEQNKSNI
jgi:acetylornithine deacetylase/succinyl-diaminopimelate desuccinylase-like protein